VAARWLEEGRKRHYAVVPAADAALVDAWFRLSFGQQQAHGISEVHAEPWPKGVRRAEPPDVDALVQLAPLLLEHQGLSPVFSSRPPWDPDWLRAEIEQDIGSEELGSFVAEVDGRIVGNFEVM